MNRKTQLLNSLQQHFSEQTSHLFSSIEARFASSKREGGDILLAEQLEEVSQRLKCGVEYTVKGLF